MEKSLEKLTLNQELSLTDAKVQIGEQLGLSDEDVDRLFPQLQQIDAKGTVTFQENTMSPGSFKIIGKDQFGYPVCNLSVFPSERAGEDPQVRDMSKIERDEEVGLRRGVRSGEDLEHDV